MDGTSAAEEVGQILDAANKRGYEVTELVLSDGTQVVFNRILVTGPTQSSPLSEESQSLQHRKLSYSERLGERVDRRGQ